MPSSKSHKGEITEENRAESGKLKAIYDAKKQSGWLAEQGITSQGAFGSTYGIGNQAAVWQCLNAAVKISKKQAVGFAAGLGCSVSDFSPRLAAEIELLAGVDDAANDEFAMVRRADVKFSAGHGHIVFYEGDKSALSFRKEFLRHIGVSEANAVIVSVVGSSMEPTIKDGAVLLLNQAPTSRIIDGQIYAFRYDGKLLVKRLHQFDGGFLAVSDNPDRNAYPDVKITEPSEFGMIGRALWMGVRL